MNKRCENCGTKFDEFESPYYCYDCMNEFCWYCMETMEQCKDCYEEERRRREDEEWF